MKRLQVVDELKALAVVLVILFHAIPGPINYTQGQLGVDIFLVVSGFTLAIGSTELTRWEFIKRRLTRIYPPYWIAFGFFLAFYYFTQHMYWYPWPLFFTFFGLQAFIPAYDNGNVNGSWWFMSLIKLCYATFFGVKNKTKDISLMILVCALIITAFITFYALIGASASAGGSMAFFLPSFFIGIFAGRLYEDRELNIELNWKLVTGLVIFAVIAMLGLGNNILGVRQMGGIGYIALWLGFRSLFQGTGVGSRVLREVASIGVISYELYLFHFPFVTDFPVWIYKMLEINPTALDRIYWEGVGLCVTFLISLGVHALSGRIFKRTKYLPV